MRRLQFILWLVCFCVVTIGATQRRALIIGIGDYPEQSGWAKINGDKDVAIVKDILISNGYSQNNIATLVNKQATSAAIKSGIQHLIADSQQGDVVYIHFSGHGQQITDLNGDEEDGYDEAWIPYDAQFAYAQGKYEGQNHLVDDQLNEWFSQIRAKIGERGKLVVVADACHSGGGSRAEGIDTLVVRGTADAFILPAKAQSATFVPKPIRWVYISACKPYQSNYEYKGNGSLTYALSQQKSKLQTISCEQLQRAIRATIREIIPYTQTPVVETCEGCQEQTIF